MLKVWKVERDRGWLPLHSVKGLVPRVRLVQFHLLLPWPLQVWFAMIRPLVIPDVEYRGLRFRREGFPDAALQPWVSEVLVFQFAVRRLWVVLGEQR